MQKEKLVLSETPVTVTFTNLDSPQTGTNAKGGNWVKLELVDNGVSKIVFLSDKEYAALEPGLRQNGGTVQISKVGRDIQIEPASTDMQKMVSQTMAKIERAREVDGVVLGNAKNVAGVLMAAFIGKAGIDAYTKELFAILVQEIYDIEVK